MTPFQLSWRLKQESQLCCILKPEAYPHHQTGVYLGGIASEDIPNDAVVLYHTLDGRLGVKSDPNQSLIYSFSNYSWMVEEKIKNLSLEGNQQTHFIYDRRPAADSHALVHVITPTFQLPKEEIKEMMRVTLKELFHTADQKKMGVMSLPPLGMGLLGGIEPLEAAVLLVEGLKEYWETHPEGGTTFLVSVDEGWFPKEHYAGMTDKIGYWSFNLFAYEAVLNAMLSTVSANESVVTDFRNALCAGFHWVTGPDFFKPQVY